MPVMKRLFLHLIFTPSVWFGALAIMLSTDVQEVLSGVRRIDGEKVVGDNPAHYCNPSSYCDSESQHQLFSIEEFTVLSNPPKVDSRFFTYLDGWAPDVPGLDDARLKFIATLNGTDSLVAEHKLSDFPNIVVRKDHKYGGPLKPGRVELIGDGFIPGMFVKTGNYTFRAESWLPDRRLLFCFKASLFLKGDL